MKTLNIIVVLLLCSVVAGCVSRGAWAYYDPDFDNGYKGYDRPVILVNRPLPIPVAPRIVAPMEGPIALPPNPRRLGTSQPGRDIAPDRPVDLNRPPPIGRPAYGYQY